MIEILPNWHPIFVHFTVALLSISVLLFVVVQFLPMGSLREQWQTVAQWNLWLGAGFTVCTVVAGVFAYNSLAHDTPSHAAMTEHHNWALLTAVWFIIAAIWIGLRARAGKSVNAFLLIVLLVGGGLLSSTAWHGGEVVYRYGLGVMSLPKTDSHDHTAGHHEHASDHHAAQMAEQPETFTKEQLENCELPEKKAAPQADSKDKAKDAHTHKHEDAHSHEGHAH